MKSILKTYRKPIIILFVLVVIIAGFLDIKYEGLFFQLLPDSIQLFLSDFF